MAVNDYILHWLQHTMVINIYTNIMCMYAATLNFVPTIAKILRRIVHLSRTMWNLRWFHAAWSACERKQNDGEQLCRFVFCHFVQYIIQCADLGSIANALNQHSESLNEACHNKYTQTDCLRMRKRMVRRLLSGPPSLAHCIQQLVITSALILKICAPYSFCLYILGLSFKTPG